MSAVILIPTYNEALSIVELLQKLRNFRESSPFEFDVLILDDNSPDKTAEVVEKLHHSWVKVLKRPGKDGLGNAYRAGFNEVLPLKRYEKIVTMDADGSHLVEDLPRLLNASLPGKSIVLGTRWIPGGKVVHWPKYRQLISRMGTFYARVALNINLHDLTGGFRIYSRELLENLHLERMNATGYCFQIEMALAAHLAGAHEVEVPITFVERINGKSKMSRAIVVEALWQTTKWGLSRAFRPNADKLHYVK